MALFTDGLLTDVEQLMGYESSILEAARTEGIELGVKLQLAQEEVGIALKRFLVQQGAGDVGLGHVVASEALRKWHAFQTLALVYRDAYSSQLNDRYLAKWKEWERMAEWARTALFDIGVGILTRPIPKAQPPRWSTISAPLAGATYYIRVSWVNAEGVEGAPSEPSVVTTADGQGLSIRVTDPPAEVSGWNLYAGYSLSEAMLQNPDPIPKEGIWETGSGGLVPGRKPSAGQDAEYYVQRGGVHRRERGSDPRVLWLLRG